jgi:hypothetical protein
MRIIATTIACLMCAGPLAAQQTQVGGFETYAVVAPTTDEAAARPFAEQHCGRYGRFAYFRRMDGTRAIFDCSVEMRQLLPTTSPFGGRGIY